MYVFPAPPRKEMQFRWPKIEVSYSQRLSERGADYLFSALFDFHLYCTQSLTKLNENRQIERYLIFGI